LTLFESDLTPLGFLFYHFIESYGRVVWNIEPDMPAVYIAFMFISPELQSQGLGMKLLSNLVGRISEKVSHKPFRAIVESKRTPGAIGFWWKCCNFSPENVEDAEEVLQRSRRNSRGRSYPL
jgi:GNAT superfamily N-acetyltransferase